MVALVVNYCHYGPAFHCFFDFRQYLSPRTIATAVASTVNQIVAAISHFQNVSLVPKSKNPGQSEERDATSRKYTRTDNVPRIVPITAKNRALAEVAYDFWRRAAYTLTAVATRIGNASDAAMKSLFPVGAVPTSV